MDRFLFVIISFSLIACSNKKIVRPNDYDAFLSDDKKIEKQVGKVNAELDFWQARLIKDTGNFVDMLQLASNYTSRFKVAGNVNDLHMADSFYSICLQKVKASDPEIFFSMAQNAITQHRFQDAWKSLLIADSIGVNPYILNLLKFDAAMEIGLYSLASSNLEKIRDKNNFDYLVRKAKLEDHNGDLDNAIVSMEKALKDAEAKDKKPLILWARSNLADMYGHAGRIQDSYNKYLEVLRMDSNYLYALKGIAWIAYSHDHNTKEAKRILNYILSQTSMPDLFLTLAEIEEFDGNGKEKERYVENFLAEVEKPGYGNMYNKYLVKIYTDEKHDYNKALAIAEKEVNSRPTAETNSWLAWAHYKMGNTTKAYELIRENVLNKSFEPEVLLHAGNILRSSGKTTEAKKVLNECLESSFELGPVSTSQIRKDL